MGIRRFLEKIIMGKKTNTLLLDTGKEYVENKEEEEDKEFDVKAYFDNGNVRMTVQINNQEVTIGELDTSVVRQVHATDTIKIVREGFQQFKVSEDAERAKQEILVLLRRLQFQDPSFRFNQKGLDIINKYKIVQMDCQQDVLNYERLNELPHIIDWNGVSMEEKIKIGNLAQKRLNLLSQITNLQTVKEHKESLVYYMKSQEKKENNPFVEASFRSKKEGVILDDITIIEIAKEMENLPNEDGALYSVFLKLEEKRILKKLQEKIGEYMESSENKEEIEGLYTELQSDIGNLNDKNGVVSYDILRYILEETKESTIGRYITATRAKDIRLLSEINTKCSDIEDIEEISRFLKARIASVGQVSKSNLPKEENLRSFIEETDFKDDDDREVCEFLLHAARVEERYIKKNYGMVIQLFKDRKEEKTLREELNVGFTPTINSAKQTQEHEPVMNIQEEIE